MYVYSNGSSACESYSKVLAVEVYYALQEQLKFPATAFLNIVLKVIDREQTKPAAVLYCSGRY
jgi:hypothetical protein